MPNRMPCTVIRVCLWWRRNVVLFLHLKMPKIFGSARRERTDRTSIQRRPT